MGPAAADYVSVKAPPDPQTLRAEVETNVTTILLTLSAVTLIGAILALTNTMTTAVIERRSEFGLRRAIGAKRTHITGLVLTEALTIGALGGIAGTYLATLALLGTTLAQGWQPVLDPATIPIGILTGITIATLSSLLATVKAAQTQPTEALHS